MFVIGAALAGSMDVTTVVIFVLDLLMSRPTVVGVVGDFTPALHDDTIAAITTVMATIRITAITGETPLSSLEIPLLLPDLLYFDFTIVSSE